MFLGEDLVEMGIAGFVLTLCESPPADPSCGAASELLLPLASTPEVPHSLLEQSGSIY